MSKTLDKALKDLPAPESSAALGSRTLHDYSNTLPHELRQQGYRLSVEVPKGDFNGTTVHSIVEHPTDGIVAHVYGHVSENPFNKFAFIEPHAKGVHTAHQGKRLGFHAYEALLNHAHNQMGVEEMAPGPHSEYAERAHQALAQKHGFKTILPASTGHYSSFHAPSANPNLPSASVVLTHGRSLYKLTPEQVKRMQEKVSLFRRMLQGIRSTIGMSKTESLDKAIKDLPKPKIFELGKVFDYSHNLPQHLRDQGYQLHVHKRMLGPIAIVTHPSDGEVANIVGNVKTTPNGRVLVTHANPNHENHIGKGLGFYAYQAVLNHAHNRMGVERWTPDSHSALAEKAHQKLVGVHEMKTVKPSVEDVSQPATGYSRFGPSEYHIGKATTLHARVLKLLDFLAKR